MLPKEYYDRHAAEFDVSTYWRYDEEALVARYFTRPDGSLLVLGCGAGRTLLPLYEKGFSITAVDVSPQMVAYAKKKVEGTPIVVMEMDATNLTFPDRSFDYVFFPFHGIDCVYPDIYASVREAARVLKPDGTLMFNSHNRFYLKNLHHFFRGPYDDMDGVRLYRVTPLDRFRLWRYFRGVRVVQRISLLPWKTSNWRDRAYKLLPFLNKSTYYVCRRPR